MNSISGNYVENVKAAAIKEIESIQNKIKSAFHFTYDFKVTVNISKDMGFTFVLGRDYTLSTFVVMIDGIGFDTAKPINTDSVGDVKYWVAIRDNLNTIVDVISDKVNSHNQKELDIWNSLIYPESKVVEE